MVQPILAHEVTATVVIRDVSPSMLPMSVQWGRGVKVLTRIGYSARHELAYLEFDDGSEYSVPPACRLRLVAADHFDDTGDMVVAG